MNWYKISQYDKIDWNLPPVLYHATFMKYVPSIKADGLKDIGTICNWHGCAPGVYLAQDPDIAYSYVEVGDAALETGRLTEEDFENIVVLEIDTNQLDKSKIFLDPNNLSNWDNILSEDKTLIYTAPIPPYAIKNLNSI